MAFTTFHIEPRRLRRLLQSRAGKIGLALFVLNEIRGVCVVAGILLATHGRIF